MSRYMTIGTVTILESARTKVALISPKLMAKAKAAPVAIAERNRGNSTHQKVCETVAPKVSEACV